MNNLESGDFLDFNKQNRGNLPKRASLILPKNKEVYFKKINDIKDFYQEKNGDDIDNIKIKPYSELSADNFYNTLISRAKGLDENKNLSVSQKNRRYCVKEITESVNYLFMNIVAKIENNFRSTAFRKGDNIYVPTGLMSLFKKNDISLELIANN